MPAPIQPPSNDLPLATLSPGGTPPTARLTTATDARTIYWRMQDAARERHGRAALIQRMFNGGAPYNAHKRRQRGEGWMANFSSLEGLARKDAAKVPYYDLFSSASEYVHAGTNLASPAVDASTASRIRSEAFDRMLRSWPAFDSQFNQMLDDFIKFDLGAFWWPKPDSWHFKVVPWNRIFFPDGTSTDSDEWDCFALKHEWTVSALYKLVKDADAAAAAGWKRESVWRAIRSAVPKDVLSGEDPMALEAAFKGRELAVSAGSAVVQAASIYVREFEEKGKPGKWSRMVVVVDSVDRDAGSSRRSGTPMAAEQSALLPKDQRDASKDWLFRKDNVAENVGQIVCPFIFEEGTGNINALSGLGPKIVSSMQAKDRMNCTVVDNTFLRSSVVLQAMNGTSQQKAGAVQIGGGITLIPPGLNVQPGTIFGDIESALAVMQDMDRRLDANTGIYRPQFEKPQGNPESATAANIRFSQATVLTNSAVNRFMRSLDRFYSEVHRRAAERLPQGSKDEGIKAALAYQRDCAMNGLSEQQCRDHDPALITAVRTIGNGSPVMRQQMAAALLTIYPLLGPRGRRNTLIAYVAAHAGQQGVRDFMPPEDQANVPTRDAWDASQEEADMHQGASVVFAPWQDSVVHSLSHLQAGGRAVQAVQQGADPSQNAIFLQTLVPHIEQHIQAVGHPAIQKQLAEQLSQLEAASKDVIDAAKQQMQQQQQGQNMTFEQQLKVQELQADIALKDQKNKAQLAQRQERHQLDMKQKGQQVALTDATTAAGIQQQTAATVADIELKRRKTEADIEAARAKAAAKPSGGGE